LAANDISGVLRISGRVAISPTDFSGSFPFGGTEIGSVGSVVSVPGNFSAVIEGEEFGGHVLDTVISTRGYIVAFMLRTYDDDAWSTVFPFTEAGGVSGKTLVRVNPTTSRPGSLGSAQAVSLLFYPDNPLHHPALYFKKAIPEIDEAAELASDLRTEFQVPAIFRAIPPASGDTAQQGLFEDFTL